ncbi:DHS-like NAD/FAD-binding domain-containing protein [Thelephora ganbajun]|uniref:DHS-like NAD/FAD-binding domain-containing protein n=1 Tax=Thelephora ganbajun TaxID=370292 RepID=A0ACB6ZW35_THEGA|nr:DHS-like NAD/FAD-binding domain-containing protein [Thelephora ganbajun]
MATGPSTSIQAFREVVKSSQNIIVIAGAGLSAASGIPTFRDGGGLWRKYEAKNLATPRAFAKDPSRVWQFYHMRREKARGAEPNAAHMTIAALSVKETLRYICPNAESFTLITQNVDGLSRRALDQLTKTLASKKIFEKVTSEPQSIIEMHGRLFDTICKRCRHREANYNSPICAALEGTEVIVERQEQEPDIPLSDLPRCTQPDCGGLLRPGVVWFEEIPHHLQEIDEIVQKADLAIVVGTSSTVYPAAGYAFEVAEHGGTVAVFNLDRSDGDSEADYLFLGPCAETLPQILASDQPWLDDILKVTSSTL